MRLWYYFPEDWTLEECQAWVRQRVLGLWRFELTDLEVRYKWQCELWFGVFSKVKET